MNEMRKHNIICLSICLVGLLTSLAIVYFRYTVPYWQCSEVYKRYHKVEGVEAAYVKNFPINDTLTIAVTLLQAADSAGWEYLLQAFNIPEDVRLVLSQLDHKVFDWQSPRNHPEIRAATQGKKRDTSLTNNDIEICLMEFKDRRIGIFHTQNENEVCAVTNYNLDNIINKKNVLHHD